MIKKMKRLNTLTITHLALMCLMILGTIGATINFIIGFTNSATSMDRFSNLSNVVLMIIILAMLMTGVLYLVKDYSKQAAKYYKLFLILNVIVCILTIFIDLFFYKSTTLMYLISVLNACKIITLLMLAYGKDLGEKKTWTIFYILLAIDIIKLVFAVINMSNTGFDFSFAGYVTALIADGTIGLAIKGKYDDKKARGTE